MVKYVNLGYKPKSDDLIAMYYVEIAPECKDLEQACEEIAKESSIGTWTEIATLSPDIAENLKPSAFYIDPKRSIVKIAYSKNLFEAGNLPQILSAIAGNIFGMKVLKSLRLLDISFPKEIVEKYRGPKYGIDGIRKLTNIKDRPLLGTIVKPKVGLNEVKHAEVCGNSWRGGLDIVKDDENLTNMIFNKFEKRIIETLKVRDQIEKETGERKFYMPNITAPLTTMIKRADFVIEKGGEYVMVDIITVGFSALQELRDYLNDKDVIIHAHRAMHAALTRSKTHGISMLCLAKLMRLIGMDQLHTGTIVGKMEGGKQETLDINQVITESQIYENHVSMLNQNWMNLKPTLPVASGGLSPLHIPELLEILGKDIVFQFGGGCHGHPNGTEAGARAIRQALRASLDGIELSEYAKTHEELTLALEKWG
ncbi:MAG: type III ribulose-bisphosphate carboxylase [Promethearchaeota archaeon]|jgi:ribulose-bisphosphate carboxylase large chain